VDGPAECVSVGALEAKTCSYPGAYTPLFDDAAKAKMKSAIPAHNKYLLQLQELHQDITNGKTNNLNIPSGDLPFEPLVPDVAVAPIVALGLSLTERCGIFRQQGLFCTACSWLWMARLLIGSDFQLNIDGAERREPTLQAED
jgi:hypothetical protein